MSVKFFGQFLIQRGEVDAGHIREALERMEPTNRSLGELAVEAGFLSGADAERVNAAQHRQDQPFGKLAVEMRLLTTEQLEATLRKQEQSRLRLGEALLQLGHLSEDRLGVMLDQFKADQAPYELERSELPVAIAGNGLAESLVDLLPKLCMRLSRLHVKMSPGRILRRAPDLPFAASVTLMGTQSAEVTLATDRSFGEQLAAGTVGCDAGSLDDSMVADGIGEFLNVLAGNAIGVLERAGAEVGIDPPCYGTSPCRGISFGLVSTSGRGVLVLDTL